MKSFAPLVATALLLFAAACGQTPKKQTGPISDLTGLAPLSDAPYELADDDDLAEIRARYDAMSIGEDGRAKLRTELADEYARRIDRAFIKGTREDAYDEFLALMSLWAPADMADSESLSTELSPYKPHAVQILDAFSRSGGDYEATAALAFLAAMYPHSNEQYIAELDEIIAFADELSISEWGEGAVRARPIRLLENAAEHFPIALVVDRLMVLYVDRQNAISTSFDKDGADFTLIRAHGDGVLRTTWNITRILARAGRLDEATATLRGVKGIGDDIDLRDRMAEAYAPNAIAANWAAFARLFLDDTNEQIDALAASAVCAEGLRRFPNSAQLHLVAAAAANRRQNITLAIRHYEAGLAAEPDNLTATNELAELYRIRLGVLAFAERPLAAQERLAELEEFHAAAEKRFPDETLESDLADAYASMGRGLVSMGELEQARAYLERSLELRPTYDALDFLGQVAYRLDDFEDAARYFDAALTLPHDTLGERFARAKLLRQSAEAYGAMGDDEKKMRHHHLAMREWASLSQDGPFADRFQAEMHIEFGRSQWAIGNRDDALESFDTAIDIDKDGAQSHIAVVAFLIIRDQYERALDVYHRGLGSHGIGDYYKVFMSLWVLAESRRQGLPEDPLVTKYLTSREGRLWYDDLARFATGRIGVDDLKSRATTRPRRAELMYYAAVLGDASSDATRVRTLMARVVDTGMVLFFEYEMAKHWLANGFSNMRDAAASSAP